MGVGFRVYGFGDDGQVRRIPVATFTRLYEGARESPIAEYAGRRIKIAMACLETHHRKPLRMVRLDCFVLGFDEIGYVDQREKEEALDLGLKAVEPMTKPKDILEELRPSLARLKRDDKFRWTPTDAQRELIDRLTFI